MTFRVTTVGYIFCSMEPILSVKTPKEVCTWKTRPLLKSFARCWKRVVFTP